MKHFKIKIMWHVTFSMIPGAGQFTGGGDDGVPPVLVDFQTFAGQESGETVGGVFQSQMGGVEEKGQEFKGQRCHGLTVVPERRQQVHGAEAVGDGPLMAFAAVGEGVQGIGRRIGRKSLPGGFSGPSVENQVEDAPRPVLFRQHPKRRGLAGTGPGVDLDDSTPGLEDGALLVCGG